MRSEFATAQRIVVAPGSSAELADLEEVQSIENKGKGRRKLTEELV